MRREVLLLAKFAAGVISALALFASATGLTAVTRVLVVWVTSSGATEADPNRTAVASVKPLPVIVTVVPPALGPLSGSTPVTSGTGR